MFLSMAVSAAICGLPNLVPDGAIGDAEWRGAAVHAMDNGGRLRIAGEGGVLCLAVEGEGGPHYTDLYLAGPTGEIVNLHASMRLGQRRLPRAGGWDAGSPAWVWEAEGWQANAGVWRPDVAADQPIEARITPSDGQEFIIDLDRLGSGPWRLRVEASAFRGQQPDAVYPRGARPDQVADWLELPPAGSPD